MHKVSHQGRKAIEFALEPMVVDRDVLSLNIAGLVEAFAKCSGKGRIG